MLLLLRDKSMAPGRWNRPYQLTALFGVLGMLLDEGFDFLSGGDAAK